MPTINQLSAVDTLAAGDQLPLFSLNTGDSRKAAISVLLAYLQEKLDFTVGAPYVTQYSAPSATGFSVAIDDSPNNVHLILTPVAGYAGGTIILPSVEQAVDGQMITVNCTQAVTTLTVDGNGATAVTGEPSALTANAFFTLKYDAPTSSWYRVG